MQPSILVIFGFTGDLVGRYFLPALYHLEAAGALPEDMAIIGTTRRKVNLEDIEKQLKARVHEMRESCDDAVIDKLLARLKIAELNISDAEDYSKLKQLVESYDEKMCKNRLLYFAVSPKLVSGVLENVVTSGLHDCGGGISARLLIEKPFGQSPSSAEKLLAFINQHFGPEHLFPIDHYLAKETVQNILYFRFHNPIIRAVWNPRHIKQIQITALEDIDIQGRVNFYEQTGALKDMIQSHLLQLAGLATMNEPEQMNSEGIRSARQKALESFARFSADDAVAYSARGQYEGYRNEVNNPDSGVETFAAVRFSIDHDDWRHIPIYLRAGKAMDMKKTEITLIYDDPATKQHDDNVLTLRIQPNEGVALRLTAKKPGLNSETKPITLDYCYEESGQLNDAYEKIVYDALRGDQTLFPTDREIINNWRLLEPIIESWNSSDGLEIYEKGSPSLDSADQLLAKDGNQWVSLPNICLPRYSKET